MKLSNNLWRHLLTILPIIYSMPDTGHSWPEKGEGCFRAKILQLTLWTAPLTHDNCQIWPLSRRPLIPHVGQKWPLNCWSITRHRSSLTAKKLLPFLYGLLQFYGSLFSQDFQEGCEEIQPKWPSEIYVWNGLEVRQVRSDLWQVRRVQYGVDCVLLGVHFYNKTWIPHKMKWMIPGSSWLLRLDLDLTVDIMGWPLSCWFMNIWVCTNWLAKKNWFKRWITYLISGARWAAGDNIHRSQLWES
jgi:hypothetical protein